MREKRMKPNQRRISSSLRSWGCREKASGCAAISVRRIAIGLLACFILIQCAGWPGARTVSAAGLTTQYRVFQNENMLREFANANEAITYSKRFLNSYVERIDTREWIFSYFPRYYVYQKDTLIGKGYHHLDEAIREAKKWSHASVRDLHGRGWVWDNYPREPRYRVYQGEKTFAHWTFHRLDEAKKEAVKWANAHIIDLADGTWVWDNRNPEDEKLNGEPVYEVRLPHGGKTSDSSEDVRYNDLKAAVLLASKTDGATVVNVKTGKTVYANEKPYVVSQNRKPLRAFGVLDAALQYAVKWANADISVNGREIWNNYAFYQVIDANGKVTDHLTPQAALEEALKRPKAQIRDYHGKTIFSNAERLQVWVWTGTAADDPIRERVEKAAGIDVLSPTWYKLLDADGQLEDQSSADLAKWLHERQIEVHPLVHNQFDPELTERFLKNEDAQNRFITAVVKSAAAAGADGINVDFESMKGSDRKAYTAFIEKFAREAHQHGLKISVALPRGSASWNHLTAFDHVKLGQIVDYIHIMTYDQHWSGSETPGTVAGMSWAEEGIKQFLAYGIPREKLYMGIPFYVREWKLDRNGNLVENRALYAGDVAERLKGKNVKKDWDPDTGQYRIEFEEDGYTYLFWLEDEETVKSRMNIAKTYRLHGVAAWRLGQEAPGFWQAIVSEKN